MKRSGILISIEGGDGCGKSTQARLLCDALAARGVPVGPARAPGAVLREPGGTPAAEAVRELLLHGPHLTAWSEALLYAAARAELVHRVLIPALTGGRVLVLDRFLDSSLAYQGHARGLGIEAVRRLNEPGLQGVLPHLTVVLEVPATTGLARAGDRPDRLEREGVDLQARVVEGYRLLAAAEPQRVRLVDGQRPPEAVAADVLALALPLVEGEHV